MRFAFWTSLRFKEARFRVYRGILRESDLAFQDVSSVMRKMMKGKVRGNVKSSSLGKYETETKNTIDNKKIVINRATQFEQIEDYLP